MPSSSSDVDEADSPEAGDDAPACFPSPAGGVGGESADCFAVDSCSRCGVPAGRLYWCAGDAPSHPAIAGCVADVAQSGWSGSCCPGAATCTRLSDDDATCAAQCSHGFCLPGHAFACSASAAAPSGCLPSGTTFTVAGVPVLPGVAGAALSPAQGSSLFCCP